MKDAVYAEDAVYHIHIIDKRTQFVPHIAVDIGQRFFFLGNQVIKELFINDKCSWGNHLKH